jgi:hypothetical protein
MKTKSEIRKIKLNCLAAQAKNLFLQKSCKNFSIIYRPTFSFFVLM